MRAVLAVPGARSMAAWSFLGRFGFAMTNIGLLLFVQARTGSYGIAGALSAASLVGTAVGTVAQGRLIDRYGPTRPLLVLSAAYAALGAAAIAGITAGLAPSALAALIAVQCAALPAVPIASRTMWPRLIPSGSVRDAAYGYEAISFELCWLLGPAASGLLATLLWPGSGLLVAVVLAALGATGFALTRAVRSAGAGESAGDRATAETDGVDRAGLAVLLLAAAGFGLGIGFVVVGVSAGTAANGVPALAGVLLAVLSASSILGGLAYRRWPWAGRTPARLPWVLGVFALILALPALAGDEVALAVMIVLGGLTLVPQITAHSEALDHVVPPARLNVAYGLVTTAIAVANAAGQATGGIVIDRYDHRAAFTVATATVLVVSLGVWSGRRRLALGS